MHRQVAVVELQQSPAPPSCGPCAAPLRAHRQGVHGIFGWLHARGLACQPAHLCEVCVCGNVNVIRVASQELVADPAARKQGPVATLAEPAQVRRVFGARKGSGGGPAAGHPSRTGERFRPGCGMGGGGPALHTGHAMWVAHGQGCMFDRSLRNLVPPTRGCVCPADLRGNDFEGGRQNDPGFRIEAVCGEAVRPAHRVGCVVRRCRARFHRGRDWL